MMRLGSQKIIIQFITPLKSTHLQIINELGINHPSLGTETLLKYGHAIFTTVDLKLMQFSATNF